MDTNIVSRLMIPRQPEHFGTIDVAVIAVLDLTEETHGNASGIGLANVTTARVVEKTDWTATYTNAVTSGIFGMFRSGVPITMADDRRALQVTMRGCACPAADARLVFINDTLAVDRLWVSPNLRQAVEEHPRLEIIEEVPLSFGPAGNMISPWQLDDRRSATPHSFSDKKGSDSMFTNPTPASSGCAPCRKPSNTPSATALRALISRLRKLQLAAKHVQYVSDLFAEAEIHPGSWGFPVEYRRTR